MPTLTLQHQVCTVDNRLLLPAGTTVSTETLDTLISSSGTTPYPSFSMLGYKSVKRDLLHFLSLPPYHIIFSDQGQISDLINIMESVHLVQPVLQSLDYFKKHDFYTYRHVLAVFALTTLLAKDLISRYRDLIHEIRTGPSHDLGKICVPPYILKKVDPLTPGERSILKHHSAAGFVLLCCYLQDTQNLAVIVARDHHERRDGSGYPRGIKLTDRMVEIVTVSDIYDALTSGRPYRPVSYDNRTALEEITAMAEKDKISLELVKALISHNREGEPHYSEVMVSTEKRGTPPPGNVYGITAEEEMPPSDLRP